MYKYRNTAARLAAWRKCSYRKPGENLPPNYFGQTSEPTVTRDDRGNRLHYGDGLGVEPSRPFRFVGFADEVCPRSIRHTGWHADAACKGWNLYRGVVFQIPARGGNTQYMIGMEWGESGARRSFDPGGGFVDFTRRAIYESKEDAALAADSLAERLAERDRQELMEEEEREREEEEERERIEEENHAERMALCDAPMNGAD